MVFQQTVHLIQGSLISTLTWRKSTLAFLNCSLTDTRYSLIYPQTITLYQVDDQIYEPEEVATTNLFNTFLDALDGVSRS